MQIFISLFILLSLVLTNEAIKQVMISTYTLLNIYTGEIYGCDNFCNIAKKTWVDQVYHYHYYTAIDESSLLSLAIIKRNDAACS